jgi:hypothetical protein
MVCRNCGQVNESWKVAETSEGLLRKNRVGVEKLEILEIRANFWKCPASQREVL